MQICGVETKVKGNARHVLAAMPWTRADKHSNSIKAGAAAVSWDATATRRLPASPRAAAYTDASTAAAAAELRDKATYLVQVKRVVHPCRKAIKRLQVANASAGEVGLRCSSTVQTQSIHAGHGNMLQRLL